MPPESSKFTESRRKRQGPSEALVYKMRDILFGIFYILDTRIYKYRDDQTEDSEGWI